jgi:hypothetical protein
MNTTGAKILSLIESRDVPSWFNVTETVFFAKYGLWGYPCGGRLADKLIAKLESFPQCAGYVAPTPAVEAPREPQRAASERPTFNASPKIERRGMFRLNGEIYKVVENPRTGRLNAHLLDMETRKYTYAKGVLFRLTEANRLTVDEVATHGLDQLWCLCCGRDLDRQESRDRGIGPICAEKYGY